jgi:hypothetical protein
MTRFGWWSLNVLARGLEPSERDAVLGDLTESGEGMVAGIRDLLGLIIRRQAALWTSWRPWLALFGISCLVGVPLSRIAFRLNVNIGQQFMAYQNYGVHYGTGLTAGQDLAFLLCLAGALLGWSWTCGFVLGCLSGRAAWFTWLVFYLVVLDSAWARFVLAGNIILLDPRPLRLLMVATLHTLPFSTAALLFLFPALLGAFMGVRPRALPVHLVYLLGSVIAILTILTMWTSGWYETAQEVWSGGAWHGDSWPVRLLPFLLVSWPAAYMLATAYRQHTEGVNGGDSPRDSGAAS